MLVTLIGKGFMYKLVLPKKISGSYWISDKTNEREIKLVNIEGIDGKWQIRSNSFAKIINTKNIAISPTNLSIVQEQGAVVNKVILKEYQTYCISLGNSKDIFVLQCSPVYEDNMKPYVIKNTKEILIGNGNEGKDYIIYKNPLVSNVHARLYFFDGIWRLENLDRRYGTFVNSKVVYRNSKNLNNGDVIFIFGLKIIIMGDRLFINNPKDYVSYINGSYLIQERQEEKKVEILEEDDSEIELYSDKDYFSKAPRIINLIEKEKIKIDAPPALQNREEMPLVLTLGSTLTMGAVMLMSGVNSLSGLASGEKTLKQTWPTLITCFLMMIGMVLFPILTNRYQKRQKKKYEEKRQERYRKYINSKAELIDEIMNKQRSILFENSVSPEECRKIIVDRKERFWERKIEDADFLSMRLGIGDVASQIDIQYPEESFAMEDDELVEILNTIGNKSKTLKNAPIDISLAEKNISAVIGENKNEVHQYIQNLILQLVTFHSYEDLKIVFLLDEDKDDEWEYVKMLPHIWDDNKQIRFFADNYNDMKEVSKFIEEDLITRAQYLEKNVDYKSFMPYYLIITDSYKELENIKVMNEILKLEKNLGFSVLFMANNLMQLPNECRTFIMLDKGEGVVFDSETSAKKQKKFKLDVMPELDFDKMSQIMSNIPIRYSKKGSYLLPNTYTFMEMYDVGRVEQLNVLERWSRNDSTLSLEALIGIDSSGMPVTLDVHEKAHGPHGLIAGSTGSGKSEFIITYILSLAINYHPDDVAFLLIDYKGGGLAGAFKKRNIMLPHLVGTITNIDTVELQRSLDSIQSELRRRQILFNEARNMTNESTIDIYKYQKLYHEGVVNTPIPHLLIICDEFAELKQQQSEFMEELISVSRIGRSLGVHLILATQKPAGIVNEQIRSNSKFGICLKVQDAADSFDVIKRPDAANLKATGQFYMQVGNNEYFALGQSAWTGAPYIPSDIVKKKIDSSIDFISNTGMVIKKLDVAENKKINKAEGDQVTNIVKYLSEIAVENNIKPKQLWLDSIPADIYLEKTRNKYKVRDYEGVINPVIGEFDDPFNQRQGVVTLNLSEGGNTIIYGSADSGKETLLSTMVYDIITTHSSDEVWMYILDFGSEALKIFAGAPHVDDVVLANDHERVVRFFDMIQNEIKERKRILSEYNGDYKLYNQKENNKMPLIVATINNYEAFLEMYQNDYEEIMQMLVREGVKCGIEFIITVNAANGVRFRLSQNFKNQIALQLNKADDYYNIFEGVNKKRPSNIFGRGLYRNEDGNIYEFQTAKICEPENWNEVILDTINKIKTTNKTIAKTIPVMPNVIKYGDVKKYVKSINNVPIGIEESSLRIFQYDFTKQVVNLVSSKSLETSAQFVGNVVEVLNKIDKLHIEIFDVEKILVNNKKDIKDQLSGFLQDYPKLLKKNDYIICVIIGMDKFITETGISDMDLTKLLQDIQETKKCSFIIAESYNRMKLHEFESWYKNMVNNDSGIWVGNGIEDQYLIKLNTSKKRRVNNCGDSFGYIAKEGQATFIKLLGMKDEGDEDE